MSEIAIPRSEKHVIPYDQFLYAYRIAQVRLAQKLRLRKAYDKTVAKYIGCTQHATMVSHIVNGTGMSEDLYTQLLRFIHELAPEELPTNILDLIPEKDKVKAED